MAASYSETSWPGERAKELGIVLGKIGCPHCGTEISGALSPVCGFCDKPYWPPIEAQAAITNGAGIHCGWVECFEQAMRLWRIYMEGNEQDKCEDIDSPEADLYRRCACAHREMELASATSKRV